MRIAVVLAVVFSAACNEPPVDPGFDPSQPRPLAQARVVAKPVATPAAPDAEFAEKPDAVVEPAVAVAETPAPLELSKRTPRKTLFEFATLEVGTDAPPAKFVAPLATSDAAVRSARPAELVQLRLDQPEPVLELFAALNEATAKKKLSPSLRAYFDAALGTPGQSRCVVIGNLALREELTAEAMNVVRHGLRKCGDIALAPLFEAANADDADVAGFYASFSRASVRPKRSARFLVAAERLTATAKSDFDVLGSGVGFGLAAQDGITFADVKAVLAKSKQALVRGEVVSSFYDSSDKALSGLARSECATSRSMSCRLRAPPEPFCATGMSAAQLAQFKNPDLASCAATPMMAEMCLESEVRKSRENAAAFFSLHPEARDDGGLVGVVARTLHAYPAGQLTEALVTMGLIPRGGSSANEDPVTVLSALQAVDRAPSFSVEEKSPVRHDLLLAQLGHRIEPLQGVLFDQVVSAGGSSVLHAYLEGKSYATPAGKGKGPDVAAVLGLLNALSKSRGSDQRFIVGSANPSTFTVIYGPEAALEKVVKGGLLPDLVPNAR